MIFCNNVRLLFNTIAQMWIEAEYLAGLNHVVNFGNYNSLSARFRLIGNVWIHKSETILLSRHRNLIL